MRIDTPREADYFRHGGILQYVLRELLARPTTGAGGPAAGDGTRQAGASAGCCVDLLGARGPSGYESAPAAVWLRGGRRVRRGAAPTSIGTPLARVAAEARRRARRRGGCS